MAARLRQSRGRQNLVEKNSTSSRVLTCSVYRLHGCLSTVQSGLGGQELGSLSVGRGADACVTPATRRLPTRRLREEGLATGQNLLVNRKVAIMVV